MLEEIAGLIGEEMKESVSLDEYLDGLNAAYLSLAYFIDDDAASYFSSHRIGQDQWQEWVEADPSRMTGIAERFSNILKGIATESAHLKGGLKRAILRPIPGPAPSSGD